VDIFAWCHNKDSTRQASIVATEAEAAKRQKYNDFHIQVLKYHKGKMRTVESARKAFYYRE